MDSNHFAAGIVWRISDEGIEILVMDSYRKKQDWEERSNPRIKVPGGTNREYRDETPEQTLHREFVTESGLVFPDISVLVWRNHRRSDTGRGVHTQYFRAAHEAELRGSMRTDVIEDGGEWLSPPYWAKASFLIQNHLLMFPTHIHAIRKFLKMLDEGGLRPPSGPATI